MRDEGSARWATFLCSDKFEPSSHPPDGDSPGGRVDGSSVEDGDGGDGRAGARGTAAAAASSQAELVEALTTAIAGMSSRPGTLSVKQRVVVKVCKSEG